MNNNLYLQALIIKFSDFSGDVTLKPSLDNYEVSRTLTSGTVDIAYTGSTLSFIFTNFPEQWIDLFTVSNNVTLDSNKTHSFSISDDTGGTDGNVAILQNPVSLEVSNY